jgi:Protein of unknown function (DUF775)
VDATKAVVMIAEPATIPELTFFLLPSTPIPAGYGAVLYFSIPPFEHWVLIGSVTLDKPSGSFRTGFTTNEGLVGCPCIQLGVSLEPYVSPFVSYLYYPRRYFTAQKINLVNLLIFICCDDRIDTITNLSLEYSGVEDRFAFAHKIALDLFRYMTSFAQGGSAGSMIVPTNVFDKWMERFERKYALDPNFMMKEGV